MNTEILRIVVEGVNKGFSKVSDQVKSSLQTLKTNLQGFSSALIASNKSIVTVMTNMDATAKTGGRLGLMLRNVGAQLGRATNFMRKYRMEILGVIFFSMYLQNVFKGWLQPAMEAFGMFELFSNMLLVVFLPIIEQIFPYFEGFITYMMDLEDSSKKLIGTFAVFGLVLSTIVLWIAKFAIGLGVIGDMIGIGGISGAFKGFFSIVSRGFAAILGIGALTLAIITAIIIGAVLAWRENFLGFKTWFGLIWEGIKNQFEGVINIIKGLFSAFFALISGDTEAFWDGIKLAFSGFIQFVKGWYQHLIGIFMSLVISIVRIFTGYYTIAYDIWRRIFIWIYDIGQKIISAVKVAWAKVWDIIWGIVLKIYNWLVEKFNAMTDFIKDKFGIDIKAGIKVIWDFIKDGFKDLVNLAPNWAKDMAQGFIDGLKNMGSKILDAFNIFNRGSSSSGSGSSGSSGGSSGGGITILPRAPPTPPTQGNYSPMPERTIGGVFPVRDFILQPSGRLIKVDPNDTVMGSKNGGMGGITINQTNNVSGSLMRDIDKAISEANKRLVDDIKRMSGA